MLDQMSGGRFELGIGRGVSPFETANYALEFSQTGAMYHEAFQVLLKGLAADELTFEGKFYRFDKVPMVLKPVQRPHPPLWYGVSIPDNADWPAQNDVNVVSLAPPAAVRPIFERYLATRRKLGKGDTALYGVGRHVVVADTDAKALEIARRAYPRWRTNFFWLFQRHGSAPRVGDLYPESFDSARATPRCAASAAMSLSPIPMRRRLRSHGAPIRAGAPISSGRFDVTARRRGSAISIRKVLTNWRRCGPRSPARRRPCAISSPPRSRPPARITSCPGSHSAT